jgi:hypothetical protein
MNDFPYGQKVEKILNCQFPEGAAGSQVGVTP